MKKIQKGNQVDELLAYFDKPFLYVDFNEFIDVDLMLLCQSDQKKDIHGDPVELWEGLAVVGYQEDEDRDGRRNDLWVEGGLRTQSDWSLSSCEVATSAGFIWGTECERLASELCKPHGEAGCARAESILRKRLNI